MKENWRANREPKWTLFGVDERGSSRRSECIEDECIEDECIEDEGSSWALEILVLFGHSILHVSHLSPIRDFVLGEAGPGAPVDVALPAEAIGRRRLPLARGGERPVVLVPEGETSWVEGAATPAAEHTSHRDFPGCVGLPLQPFMRVRLELPQVSVCVAVVRRAPTVPKGWFSHLDRAALGYFGVSLGTFVGLFSVLSFFAPPFGLSDGKALEHHRRLFLAQMLDAASERDQRLSEGSERAPHADGGQRGARAPGREGQAGQQERASSSQHARAVGPKDQAHAGRPQSAREEALEFGMVGLLSDLRGVDSPSVLASFARDRALGQEGASPALQMWSDQLGESGGLGGQGRMGAGFGGGDLFGNAGILGIDRVDTIGSGRGPDGFGNTVGRPGGTHAVRSPSMGRLGETRGSGRIPPQVIQRVVRQNFGRFRMCYARALAQNPTLEGRVTVRFVVASDGSVSSASAGGELPNSNVKSCVAAAFYGLSFPAPEGGVVSVSYPLMFSPE